MNDRSGIPWAKLANVKPGTRLRCDDGFTCMRPDVIKVVETDAAGQPFIPCDDGKHYLEGQLDFEGGDDLVGLYDA